MTASRVAVVVHIPAMGRVMKPAQLYVHIEDTSELDAPAKSVSRLLLDMNQLDLSASFSLRFQVPYTGTASDLTVAATLSTDSTRPLQAGDLITPVATPLRTGRAVNVSLVPYKG